MIQGIEVVHADHEPVYIPLRGPWPRGVMVEKIDGLGPVKADVFVTNYGAQAGGYFNGTRTQKRNVVLTLAAVGNDAEDSRHAVYRMFPLEDFIKLRVRTDRHTLEAEGYVESCEPDIFSPLERFVVSIICPSPWLQEPVRTTRTVSRIATWQPTFEFPFTNTLHARDIIFAEKNEEGIGYVDYPGTKSTGVRFRIWPRQGMYFNILGPRGTSLQNIGFGIQPYQYNDVVEISTEDGNKYCRRIRDGKTVDLTWQLWNSGNWPRIFPGRNKFTIMANNQWVEAEISYVPVYVGI